MIHPVGGGGVCIMKTVSGEMRECGNCGSPTGEMREASCGDSRISPVYRLCPYSKSIIKGAGYCYERRNNSKKNCGYERRNIAFLYYCYERRNLAFLYYCYERPLLAYGESISTGSRACGPSLIKKKYLIPRLDSTLTPMI